LLSPIPDLETRTRPLPLRLRDDPPGKAGLPAFGLTFMRAVIPRVSPACSSARQALVRTKDISNALRWTFAFR